MPDYYLLSFHDGKHRKIYPLYKLKPGVPREIPAMCFALKGGGGEGGRGWGRGGRKENGKNTAQRNGRAGPK